MTLLLSEISRQRYNFFYFFDTHVISIVDQ